MKEELIEKILLLVESGKSSKEIALELGSIEKFQEFNDGVNQSRYVVKSNFGLEQCLIAVDSHECLDWISLKGENFFDYLLVT